jgi:phosphatidate cytidylyltransferase
LFSTPFVLNRESFNANIILGYFFFLWANDSGAYITGSLFGRTPLAPVISPKKTWEGSAGGALMVVVVVFIDHYLFKDLSLISWFVIGFFVIVMGTAGDLIKSVMKRSRNVKDSGKILPGHGGILDRFDSMIGSVPFVYLYLSLLN